MPPDKPRPLLPFAELLGIRVTRSESDLVEGELVVREDLCTSGEILHGGAIMSFADMLGGIATFANLPDDAKGTVTIESKTNFFRATPCGKKIVSRTTPLHRGRRTHVGRLSSNPKRARPSPS